MYGIKVLVASLVAAVIAVGSAHAAEVKVVQKNKKFDPKKITVAKGDTIALVNNDSFTHNLFSKKGQKFDSGVIKPGDVYKLKVEGGNFTVRCAIHPRMKLRVKTK